jgi:HD-GYP domain-containing protein (c-di-GMP phosphodiesterase class II)
MNIEIEKQFINTLIYALSLKDPYTSMHSHDVSTIAQWIATEMELPHDTIESISMAAKVHDIGKIGVPLEILIKPGRLSAEEYNIIKTHPQIGFSILSRINWKYPIAEIILQHHERINGTGYPYGLSNDSILLESKIIAVADITHALISHRHYRAAKDIDYTINIIANESGITLDNDICNIAIDGLINLHIT